MRMCPENERECCDTVLGGELFIAVCTVCKKEIKNQGTAAADVMYVCAQTIQTRCARTVLTRHS
jgi:hypothetical protein